MPTMPNAQSIATLLNGAGLATIPNLLSFARIVGVTLAVILYLGGHGWVAVAIGTVAGVTDHLDGYLARRLKQETALGAMTSTEKYISLCICKESCRRFTFRFPNSCQQ